MVLQVPKVVSGAQKQKQAIASSSQLQLLSNQLSYQFAQRQALNTTSNNAPYGPIFCCEHTKVEMPATPTPTTVQLTTLCTRITSSGIATGTTVRGSKWFNGKVIYDSYDYVFVIERQNPPKQKVPSRPRYFGVKGSLEERSVDELAVNDNPKKIFEEDEVDEVLGEAMVRSVESVVSTCAQHAQWERCLVSFVKYYAGKDGFESD